VECGSLLPLFPPNACFWRALDGQAALNVHRQRADDKQQRQQAAALQKALC